MKDFEEPGHLAPTGLHLGGTKYMVIQGEAGAVIRGKKVLPHSSFLIRTNYLFLSFLFQSRTHVNDWFHTMYHYEHCYIYLNQ